MELANKILPVLATRNVVIFPGTTLPLNVGRPKSVSAIEAAQAGEGYMIALAQKSDQAQEPSKDDLYTVGTLCKIEKSRGTNEHGYQILLRGIRRVHVLSHSDGQAYLAVTAEPYDGLRDTEPKTLDALVVNVKQQAKEILQLVPGDTRQLAELIAGLDDAALLTNLCSEYLEVPLSTKQELLEMTSLKQRSLKLLELMQVQKEALQLQSEIRDKLSTKMGKMQREAILREQMKAIKEELGDDEGGKASDDYTAKVKDSALPEVAKKVALEEAKRLEGLGQSSPETHIIRNYLDLLLAMPWQNTTQDNLDLGRAKELLEKDHYGLSKIKKRIIQHLAVLKLKDDRKGSILLFVGPPGVGKTSLGQSIAKALDRKFVRVSLGGVRDDAEIRGHRRTYIGAMPGRVVQGLKRAGVNNPVFMLDEIDKLGRGYSGDPASALLEVLDPEQNTSFTDHYLDVPFDLSKVFFIATANSLESIPGPLLDRMEVIDLSGYTMAEKLHIAKNHLIPKQLAEHGMTAEHVRLSDEAVMRMITHYTREAGVRDLERKVSAVLRGMTEKVLEARGPVVSPQGKDEASSVGGELLPLRSDVAAVAQGLVVELADLKDLLGHERYIHEVAERVVPPGVVTGLAWTPVGGEILFIEASLMPGSGKLTLTGQLGEVMKESAQIALSLVRSNLPSFVPGFEYDKKDIHVHVPAGAIPKDGPSAGVAMLVTFASLFTGRRVSPLLAMTGEITLRGSVMPVGGIKEKVMAAHRAGIETIILPKRNQHDLSEVPEEIKSKLKIEFVETAREVLKIALDLTVESAELMPLLDVLPPAATPSSAH